LDYFTQNKPPALAASAYGVGCWKVVPDYAAYALSFSSATK